MGLFDLDQIDTGSYLCTPPFRAYTAAVRDMLIAAAEPMSIRQIHESLGDAAVPHWTMDALEYIDGLREHGVMVTRYSVEQNIRRPEHTDWVGRHKSEPSAVADG